MSQEQLNPFDRARIRTGQRTTAIQPVAGVARCRRVGVRSTAAAPRGCASPTPKPTGKTCARPVCGPLNVTAFPSQECFR
uniref:Uncharacterized protein n=1 Tax=Dickeya chrysanthemi TaxID=556 RepID=Q8VUE6_DICCH|nr:unknown [Dickeya chrysanthemi]